MRSIGYAILIAFATVLGYAVATRVLEDSRDFR